MKYIPKKEWTPMNSLAGDERYSRMYVNAMDIKEPLNECEMENLLEMSHYGQKENVNAHDLAWYVVSLKKAGASEVKERLVYDLKRCIGGELVDPVKPLQHKVFYTGKINKKRLLELIGN